jgi:hypothetical protein
MVQPGPTDKNTDVSSRPAHTQPTKNTRQVKSQKTPKGGVRGGFCTRAARRVKNLLDFSLIVIYDATHFYAGIKVDPSNALSGP